MTSICFIGDSQSSALKRAWWNIDKEFPDITITFFSSQRRRFADLAVCGDRLVPQSEELREVLRRSCKIDPVITNDYDRYLLCGMDYSLWVLINRLTGFRSEDQTPDSRAPISDACYLRAMTGCLRESICLQVARKVRAITNRPMTIVPGPMISDATERKDYPRFRENGDAEKIARYFFSACDILGREIDADVVRQPPQTLRNPVQTQAVYALDAPREFSEEPLPEGRKNLQHMNVVYGELMLRSILATSPEGPPASR